MPIIQRNLFPRRPPTRKCDGPSVLKASGSLTPSNGSSTLPMSQSIANQQQQPMPAAAALSPNQTLVTGVPGFKKKSKDKMDSSGGPGGGSGLKISKMLNKEVKKIKTGKSASLSSLLVIGNDGPANGAGSDGKSKSTNNNRRNGNLKTDYHQFNSSTDCSSSDPLSLSSSCGSMDNPSSHHPHHHHHHNSSSNLDSGINLSDNVPLGAAGISRRKILSRSRDALNVSDDYLSSSTGSGSNGPMDEDVWFNKTKLISDHIEEIVTKWDQIDDEIWAKVICMERNRRVAKAYARAPILTVNGGDHGFDGHRIGLNGFKNPLRDKKIVEIKKEIDAGVKIRMDQNGNLLVKRMSKSDIYVVSFDKVDSFDKAESRKSVVLFDMKQFQGDLLREIKSANPNPRSLEEKCFCFVSFAKMANELLNTPVWLIVINLVALEMLVKVLPNNKLLDDNFYSLPVPIMPKKPLASSMSSNPNSNSSSNHKFANSQPKLSSTPPKLPPRDLHNKKAPLTLPDPDYDAEESEDVERDRARDEMDFQSRMMEDPYYFGLSAHVPKFAHNPNSPNNHHHNNNKPQQSAAAPPATMSPPSRVNNPPIVRKKFWSQSANNFNFKFFTSNQNNNGSGSSSSGCGNPSKPGKSGRNSLDYKSLPSIGPSSGDSSNVPTQPIYAQATTTAPSYCYGYSQHSQPPQLHMKSPPQYYHYSQPRLGYSGGSGYPVHPAYAMMYNSFHPSPHYQYPTSSIHQYHHHHQYPQYQSSDAMNQAAAIINDNNEIYGINTSLLRKNTNNQLYHRSNSSPALHHKYYGNNNNNSHNNNNNLVMTNGQNHQNNKDYNNNKSSKSSKKV